MASDADIRREKLTESPSYLLGVASAGIVTAQRFIVDTSEGNSRWSYQLGNALSLVERPLAAVFLISTLWRTLSEMVQLGSRSADEMKRGGKDPLQRTLDVFLGCLTVPNLFARFLLASARLQDRGALVARLPNLFRLSRATFLPGLAVGLIGIIHGWESDSNYDAGLQSWGLLAFNLGSVLCRREARTLLSSVPSS